MGTASAFAASISSVKGRLFALAEVYFASTNCHLKLSAAIEAGAGEVHNNSSGERDFS
jgi:hypothetical protein